MSLQSLKERKLLSAADRRADEPVGKTIMIGLGGTGKDVLLRFRRLIVEKLGSLEELPCISFLNLDTDGTKIAKEEYGLDSSLDPLYGKVKFTPAERVDLTIEGGTAKYLSNMHASYPHIKDWFQDKGRMMALGNLGQGAGQVRMACRLGFFDNYETIFSKLKKAQETLNDPRRKVAEILRRKGYQFEGDKWTVYVIASLAGGTGSGAFLDLGFLLQDMMPNATRIGIFYLPSFYSGYAGANRMMANGYAAMKELNHYLFGHHFNVTWDKNNGAKRLGPPVYEYTYLLEGKNEAGESFGSGGGENSVYQMTAENLFQEFSLGTLSGYERSTRINLRNFIDNAFVHNFWSNTPINVTGRTRVLTGDSYTTRFCSFGLSSISFPKERVQRACACKAASEILEFWQKWALEDPRQLLFEDFLPRTPVTFAQGRYVKKDGTGGKEYCQLDDALLQYPGGSDFPNYLWKKARSIRTNLESAPHGEKASTLQQARADWDELLANEDSENPDDWGQDIRTIDLNMQKTIHAVKEGIRLRAKELADNPARGVMWVLSLLQELKKILRHEQFSYIPNYREQLAEWRQAITDLGYHLDQCQFDLGKHEDRLLFRKDNVAYDLERLVPDNAPQEESLLYASYYARVMLQVCKRAIKVCEEVDEFLGEDSMAGKGLLGEFRRLSGGLMALQGRLTVKQEYFSRPRDFANHKTLYKEGDVDLWYEKWTGKGAIREATLRSLGPILLDKVFNRAQSVSEALLCIQNSAPETIEDGILDQCTEFFASRNEQPSALAMLYDESRVPRHQREHFIDSMFKRAKCWLCPSQVGEDHGFRTIADQKPYFIALNEDDPILQRNFKTYIGNLHDAANVQYVNLGPAKQESIQFYNELGGVPCFYPSSLTGVGGMQGYYNTYLMNPRNVDPDNQEELHTDKNRFTFGEIVPKSLHEVGKYTNSIRAFILARILGILKSVEYREDDNSIGNRFFYERKIEFGVEEEQLGNELAAVEILFQDTNREEMTLRRNLIDDADAILERLKTADLLHVYILLIEFYQRHVYTPTLDDSSVGGIQIQRILPGYAALTFEVKRITEEFVVSESERNRVNERFKTLRGKPFNEQLAYEEYLVILEPYTKKLGQFKVMSGGATQRISYRSSLVLDLDKVFPSPAKAKAAPMSVKLSTEAPAAEKPGSAQTKSQGSEFQARKPQSPEYQAPESPAPESPAPEYQAPRYQAEPAFHFEEPSALETPAEAFSPPPPEPEPGPSANGLIECPFCLQMTPPGKRCGVCNVTL